MAEKEDRTYETIDNGLKNPFLAILLLDMMMCGVTSPIDITKIDPKNIADSIRDQMGIPPIEEDDLKRYSEVVSHASDLEKTLAFLHISDDEFYKMSDHIAPIVKSFYGIKDIILPIMEERKRECDTAMEELRCKYESIKTDNLEKKSEENETPTCKNA